MSGTELQVTLGKGKSINESLIEGAALGLSAEEISERIGRHLSPARVIQKTKELLRGGDWLDLAEKESALLRLLQERVIELQRAHDLDSIKIQGGLIKDLLIRLDKRRAAVDSDLNTYNENVGRQLGHVVDLTLTYMKGALRDQVDPAKWDELVADALVMAQVEIEKRQKAVSE